MLRSSNILVRYKDSSPEYNFCKQQTSSAEISLLLRVDTHLEKQTSDMIIQNGKRHQCPNVPTTTIRINTSVVGARKVEMYLHLCEWRGRRNNTLSTDTPNRDSNPVERRCRNLR
uniref:Uncharacterized protein n=1 Tax=Timema poppense TaxID=170557 RepID=A0A7R9DAX9_TIMPO|nr:unnamed protein product [Timema poppensis]